jgi:hypothetical protein
VARDAQALVEIALRAAQLDGPHDLRLRRQVARNFFLRATQDVRRDLLAQRAQALEVLLALDRDREAMAEPVGVAEQPRIEEVEQRPQLAQVVLDRRGCPRRRGAPGCAGS